MVLWLMMKISILFVNAFIRRPYWLPGALPSLPTHHHCRRLGHRHPRCHRSCRGCRPGCRGPMPRLRWPHWFIIRLILQPRFTRLVIYNQHDNNRWSRFLFLHLSLSINQRNWHRATLSNLVNLNIFFSSFQRSFALISVSFNWNIFYLAPVDTSRGADRSNLQQRCPRLASTEYSSIYKYSFCL